MSRTDKDRPWWVKSIWWEPNHYNCEYDIPRGRWRPWSLDRECDLPLEPVVRNPRLPKGRKYLTRGCTWEPVWLEGWAGGWAWMHPPRWFVQHIWHDPQRTKVRDACRRAVSEYRANGEVDVMPPVDQGRNAAGMYW